MLAHIAIQLTLQNSAETIRNSRRTFIGTCATALLISALAPTAATAQKTPTAEEILNGYVAATGGKTAYEKITSSIMTGDFEITAQKIRGAVTVKAKAPDKFLIVQELAGNKFEVGYDGKIGWSRDPLHGLRVLEGKELEQLKDSAAFNSTVNWKQRYSKTEVMGIRKVDGASAYAVRLTNKQGVTTTQFYDVKSKLLLRSDSIVASPEGSVPTETYTSDYRSQNGVKVPFTIRQLAANVEAVMKMQTLKNNVPISDSEFAKPAEVPASKDKK